MSSRLLLGVDGGNSKAHVALAAPDGKILAAVAGPSVSHQAVGLQRGMATLVALTERAAREAGIDPAVRPLAAHAALCLAGADLPADVRMLAAAVATTRLAATAVVRNDAHATLRAGAPRGWGIAVICGAGINAVGATADGRAAGFPAVGEYAGDWGGGSSVGMAALRAAVRARDGRGPATSLARSVPAHFGLRRPIDVTLAIYREQLPVRRLDELAPLVYQEARGGDTAAGEIVDALGEEIATMAIAVARRLRLVRAAPDVVLGGGMVASGEPRLIDRVRRRLATQLAGAELHVLDRPPVLGALLLALDAAHPTGTVAAEARLRAGPLALG